MDSTFRDAAQRLLDFVAASPSPFHAVARSCRDLESAGFVRLSEGDPWILKAHGRYCVTRNDSSVAAIIPGGGSPSEAGFRIIGAHTDSPALRLKPNPVIERHGYIQLGVEVYGGPILASWLDRDLGLAGRVLLDGRSKATRAGGRKRQPEASAVPAEGTETRLLLVDRPIARVPEVAIHLDREVNEKGLLLNRENHLPPVIGLAGREAWDFHKWLGRELGVDPGRILDQDLVLYDLTPPAFAGLQEEFLLAPRLDNLASSHAALRALLEAAKKKTESTRIIVLYDNEEIGSSTRQGAAGPFLTHLLERLADGAGLRGRGAARDGSGVEALQRALSRSVVLSADMAHAIHPNYADKHEGRHSPKLNGGPVIKYNANARYATDGESGALFQRICRQARVPFQKYVNRADLSCGSTIGPIVSTRLGVRTVDIGSAMLSMHSCREMAGSHDPLYMVRAMRQFLSE